MTVCVALPGKVTAIGSPSAGMVPGVVEFADRTDDVNLLMVPDATVGAYVVVHSGYAIRVVTEHTAESAVRLLCPNPEFGRTDAGDR